MRVRLCLPWSQRRRVSENVIEALLARATDVLSTPAPADGEDPHARLRDLLSKSMFEWPVARAKLSVCDEPPAVFYVTQAGL